MENEKLISAFLDKAINYHLETKKPINVFDTECLVQIIANFHTLVVDSNTNNVKNILKKFESIDIISAQKDIYFTDENFKNYDNLFAYSPNASFLNSAVTNLSENSPIALQLQNKIIAKLVQVYDKAIECIWNTSQGLANNFLNNELSQYLDMKILSQELGMDPVQRRKIFTEKLTELLVKPENFKCIMLHYLTYIQEHPVAPYRMAFANGTSHSIPVNPLLFFNADSIYLGNKFIEANAIYHFLQGFSVEFFNHLSAEAIQVIAQQHHACFLLEGNPDEFLIADFFTYNTTILDKLARAHQNVKVESISELSTEVFNQIQPSVKVNPGQDNQQNQTLFPNILYDNENQRIFVAKGNTVEAYSLSSYEARANLNINVPLKVNELIEKRRGQTFYTPRQSPRGAHQEAVTQTPAPQAFFVRANSVEVNRQNLASSHRAVQHST